MVRRIVFLNVLLMFFSQAIYAEISNEDVYRALRLAQSDIGDHPGTDVSFFENISNNEKLKTQEFFFVTIGEPTSYGESIIYKQVTTLTNRSTSVELNHFTRDIPDHIFDAVMNCEGVLKVIENLRAVQNTRNTTLTRVDNQLHIQTVIEDQSFNSTVKSYFQDLYGFHSTLESNINWFVHDYQKEIENKKYTTFSDLGLVIRKQTIPITGEALILKVLDVPMSKDEHIGPNHWRWKDMYELVNKGQTFESVLRIDVLDDMSEQDQASLVDALQKYADGHVPKGYDLAKVGLQTEDDDLQARIAFVYDLSDGQKGKDIRKHYYEYSIASEELRNEFIKVGQKYNGDLESLLQLTVHDFVYEVTEFDLDADSDTKRDGTQGYWEFSQNDINYDIVNFGDSMILSFTLALSDAWTVDEIQENNEKYIASLAPKDVLGADNFYTTSYYDEDLTIWMVLEFEYRKREKKDLQKIYKNFMKKTSKKLYKQLREYQGVAE